MKRALHIASIAAVLSVLCMVVGSTVALAGPMDDARFALHRKPFFTASKTIPNLCPTAGQGSYDPNFSNLPCTDYTVTDAVGVFPGPHVFLVVGQGGAVGINGVSCGVTYNPISSAGIANDFIAWTKCADGLDFPNEGAYGFWPAPEGGLRITWANCQNTQIGASGVHAVVGAFYTYAYSEDVLSITPNNNLASGPELVIADCGGAETNLLDITDPSLVPLLGGAVHYGGNGSLGYTPCGVVATRTTTWGNIKNLYNQAGE